MRSYRGEMSCRLIPHTSQSEDRWREHNRGEMMYILHRKWWAEILRVTVHSADITHAWHLSVSESEVILIPERPSLPFMEGFLITPSTSHPLHYIISGDFIGMKSYSHHSFFFFFTKYLSTKLSKQSKTQQYCFLLTFLSVLMKEYILTHSRVFLSTIWDDLYMVSIHIIAKEVVQICLRSLASKHI